jgi:tetratricopeptide (TPR) repeat protein
VNHAVPIAVAAAAAVACGGRSTGDECERRYRAADYAAAQKQCEARFRSSGDQEAGARAAIAAYMRGDGAAGEALLGELADDPATAGAWQMAGRYRGHVGDRADAEAAHRRALDLYRRRGDEAGAADAELALSELAWRDADYEPAAEHAAAAEELARTAGEGELRAAAVQQRLLIAYDVGAYDRARASLATLRELVGADDPDVRVAEGLLHADAGRAALAHASFEQALAKAPDRKVELRRSTLLNLARADIERGQPEHAVAHVAAAAELVDGATSETAVATYRARVANALGNGAAAVAAAEAALAESPIIDWRWELELEAGRGAAAEGDVAAAERHYQAAIAALDEIRGRHDRGDFKQAMLARKRAPYDALVDLYVDAGRPEDALAIAERARARTLVEAIAARSPGAVPDAARATQRALERSVASAVDAVDGAVAVAYYRTGRAVYRFVIRGGTVTAAALAAGPGEIDRLARALRADPNDRVIADRLGQLLAPPPAPRLYLVTDGELDRAPLAAIRVGGHYLPEQSELAVAPSLTTLAALAARPQRERSGAVVVGDPRGDLAGARAEAVEVAKLVDTRPVVGGEATLTRLTGARRAHLLHLATHADERGLVLAGGTLSADELIRRQLSPELVVLATCTGAAPRDGGLWGSLAGGFLVAGSRVVLASPATLDDADARRLVLAFYRAGGADAPASALAAAQRNLIRAGLPPSAWSSIAAIGLAHPNPEES